MSELRARQAPIAAVIAVPLALLLLALLLLAVLLLAVLLLAVLLLGFGAAAAAEPTGSDDPATAVVPPRQPAEVAIAAYLIGLSRVSDPSSAFPTFEVEMFVDLSWKDPRLAFASESGDARGTVRNRSEIRDDRAFSAYTFEIDAQRKAGHYVLRFMTPLMFVMLLTWCAFWMPVGQRYRVGFIALLTVVASHTVISGTLPRLHYPTFADVLLLVCYLFATALIVVSIWAQRLEDSEEDGSRERARSTTRRAGPCQWARYSYLAATALLLWY